MDVDQLVAPVVAQLGPAQGFLNHYVRWCVTQTDAPAEFHLIGGLGVLATAAHPNVRVVLGTGRQTPNLFGMIVGKSGRARKSWSLGRAERLLEQVAADRLGLRIGSYEAAIDELQSRPYMTIFEPEFSRFLAQANGRQGGYLTALKLGLTDLYDSTPVSRRTRKSGAQIITNYRVNLIAACSESYLSEYTEPSDWTGGFLSRWLFASADRGDRFMAPDDIPEDTAGRDHLLTLLSRILDYGPSGTFRPDEPAKRTANAWASYLDKLGKNVEPRMVGLMERGALMTRKIACLLAIDRMVNVEGFTPGPDHMVLGHTETWPITTRDVETAAWIVQAHLDAAQTIVSQVEHSPAAKAKAKVLGAMPEGALVTIGHITRGAGMKRKEAAELLDTLRHEGLVDSVVAPGATGGMLFVRLAQQAARVEAAAGLPVVELPARTDEAPIIPTGSTSAFGGLGAPALGTPAGLGPPTKHNGPAEA